MTKMNIAAFSGNFRRPSVTLLLTNTIIDRLAQKTAAEIVTFNLLDLDESVCTFDRADLSERSVRIIGELESTDALIAATPIYKVAYSGLMTHAFDLLPVNALYETPVLISANGGGPLGRAPRRQFSPAAGKLGGRSFRHRRQPICSI